MLAIVPQAAQSLDYVSLATNAGIAVGFIVAMILGIKKGLDTFREKGDAAIKKHGATVAAATLLENQTLNEWSGSNREVANALQDLKDMLAEVRSALYHSRDTTREASEAYARCIHETNRELAELRHQIEMLRNRIE